MKKLALATAFTLAATTAFAGGLDIPPAVIVEDTSSSSQSIVFPLLLIAIFATAGS